MVMMTRLGFDTGFKPYYETYSDEIRAGCEWVLHFDLTKETLWEAREKLRRAPRVLKSPEWGYELKRIMERELTEIDHVILPLRNLEVSARSRLDAGLAWMLPEEITGEDRYKAQADILAMVLGRTIEACMLYSIPCTMMHFPLLVQDPEYCYKKLNSVEPIDYIDFMREYKLLAKPEQVVHGS